MDKKKLSAARKKLEEYKQSKGVPLPSGTVYLAVNETNPPKVTADSTQPTTSGQQNGHSVINSSTVQPPPTSSTPAYLNSLSHQLQQGPPPINSNPQSHTIDNPLINNAANDPSSSPNLILSSEVLSGPTNNLSQPIEQQEVEKSQENQGVHFVPSAPLLVQMNGQNEGSGGQGPYQKRDSFTDAGQNFPVNFFQSTPIAREYQPVSFGSASQQQDFYYGQPQAPLFYNVDGNTVTPLKPYQMEGAQQAEIYSGVLQPNLQEGPSINQENSQSTFNMGTGNDRTDLQSEVHSQTAVKTESNSIVNEASLISNPLTVEDLVEVNDTANNAENSMIGELSVIATTEMRPADVPVLRTATPNLRKSSVSSQDERDRLEVQAFQRMKSVQDALELQLEELRRDNSRLLNRQSELVAHIEENEMAVQELRRERDRSKEEAKKLVQPLHAKINNLYEENQRILKNSNDVGMELRSKLQEKSKQFEDMEQAVIHVTKQKLELAAELDQERERGKELESIVTKKDEEISILRDAYSKLEEKLRSEQQKEVLIHQLEDQRRHYMVQTETLQGELARAANKLKQVESTAIKVPGHLEVLSGTQKDEHGHDHQECSSRNLTAAPLQPCISGHEHNHSESCGDNQHDHGHSHEHSHDHGHSHEHSHDHGHSHEHSHDHEHDHSHSQNHEHGHGHDHHHSNDHGHDHGHSHSHDHGHSHSHDHDHSHSHDHGHEHDHNHSHDHGHDHSHGQERPPTNEFAELKKRLHHLEWENSTFRTDVDKLAVEAKEKKQYEEKYNKLKDECEKLREECQRLELLVIQLQGENDTIGDYIALYQTQRLALKESAKEKDVQLETLSKEREILLAKMAELTLLLKELKGPRIEAGDATTSASHQCPHNPKDSSKNAEHAEIEGKIRNLLTEISTSSLIENFHPCAVCSGRLMNV